jgi:uncharacterized protein YggE
VRRSLLMLAITPLALAAQTVTAGARDSIVTVTSSRSTHIAADKASLYIVIEGTAESAPDAVTRVETKMNAVSEALKPFAGRAEIDRPMTYSVGPSATQNIYPPSTAPATTLARAVIRVQLHRLDQMARLVATAIAAGARADAEVLARSVGGTIGALVDVSTSGGQAFSQSPVLNLDARFGGQSPAPEVVITATVTVRYRLLK